MDKFFKTNNIFDSKKKNKRTKSMPTPGTSSQTTVSKSINSTRSSPERDNGETSSPINSIIVRGKNENNPLSKIYICPEFGDKFEKQPVYMKKLEYARERDIRDHFLSEFERNTMLATLKFSTNYIQGFINSKDMRLMNKYVNKGKFKSKMEYIAEACCTSCKYKFKENTHMWFLYVVVHTNKAVDDPDRFDICCNVCYLKIGDALNSYEIYPKVHLTDLHSLSREGFYNRYIFPFDLSFVKKYKIKYEITDHYGKVFELIQNLLMQKKANESVLEIELATTGGIVLKESYSNVYLQRYRNMISEPTVADEVNCFLANGVSEMLQAIKTKMFYDIKGTVFATLTVRSHKPEVFDGVITFPLKPIKNNFCNLCKKTKMYYKHPILYCTKCGFTNRYHFFNKYKHLNYYSKAIKSHEMYNEMILYYDMKEYKKINNKTSNQ